MNKPFTTDEVIRAVGIKLTELRSELRADIVQLRADIGSCRGDIAVLREEIDEYGNQVPVPGPPGERGPAGDPGRDGRQGERGEPGERGLDGAAGAPGSAGERGAPGEPAYPGRACGAWDGAASYRQNDTVAHNGSEWRAVKDDPGPLPGDGWRLGAKGSRGKPGEPGKPGKPGARVAELVLADDALVLVHDDGSALSVDLKPLRERAL